MISRNITTTSVSNITYFCYWPAWPVDLSFTYPMCNFGGPATKK